MKNLTLKIFLAITLIQVSYSAFAQPSGWEIVDIKHPYITDIYDFEASYISIKCADSENCIVWGIYGGAGGFFFRGTSNGGKTWENLYKDSAWIDRDYENNIFFDHFVPRVNAIAYPNEKLFIAVGDSGMVVRTTDKGKTWHRYSLGQDAYLMRLSMLDDKYGLLQKGSHSKTGSDMMRTFDGGVTWEKMNRHLDSNLYWILEYQVMSRDKFYAITLNRVELKKQFYIVEGNWDKWESYSFPEEAREIKFVDEDNGWVSGGVSYWDSLNSSRQMIFKTTNRGKTWIAKRDTARNGYTILKSDFSSDMFGLATSCQALNVLTTDGGDTWQEIIMEKTNYLTGLGYCTKSVAVPSDGIIYIIYSNFTDRIYKYRRTTAITESSSMAKADNEMVCFPNPINDFTDLKINLSKGAMASLTICDLLGNEKQIFDRKEMQAGENIVNISLGELPAGQYFLKLLIDEKIIVEKIIKI